MAPAFVTGAIANDNTGTANTGSLGTVAAGQLVVVTISDDSAGATAITGVTDNLGNTYTKVPITQGTSSVLLNSSSTQMWYSVITVPGTLSQVRIAWNTAATGRVTAAAQYFNGFVGVPTLDQKLGATGSSTTATVGPTSATSDANELIVAGFGHAGTASAFSLGSGYTNLSTVNQANAAVGQESKVVSATGTQTATMTIAASRAYGGIIATFKDASSVQNINGSGYANTSAYGLADINLQQIIAQGYGNSNAYGLAVVTPGVATINAAGYASINGYGNAIVSRSIAAVGYANSNAYGLANISMIIRAAGYANSVAYGVTKLLNTNVIQAIGILYTGTVLGTAFLIDDELFESDWVIGAPNPANWTPGALNAASWAQPTPDPAVWNTKDGA